MVVSSLKLSCGCSGTVIFLKDSFLCLQSGNVPKDVSYTLKRLVRGLGVKSPVAQKGHFTALVCVLESISVIPCEVYIEIVVNEYCTEDADPVSSRFVHTLL